MKIETDKSKRDEIIYLSIDHLKKGQYELRILLNNNVVKTVKIIK